jgi:hypothetical protein
VKCYPTDVVGAPHLFVRSASSRSVQAEKLPSRGEPSSREIAVEGAGIEAMKPEEIRAPKRPLRLTGRSASAHLLACSPARLLASLILPHTL